MPVCSTLQDGTQIRPEAVEGGIKPGQVTVPFHKGPGKPASTADINTGEACQSILSIPIMGLWH